MRRLTVASALAVLLFAAATLRAQQFTAMPEGAGRDVIMTACTACHAPSAFAQLRQGEQAWRYAVYDMILRGAQISPSEIDAAVKYLATNFGPGVPFPGPPPTAVTLPDGAGKELVEGACGLCHGLDRVAAAKRSKGEWGEIVARMGFLLGTPFEPDRAKTMVAYLDSHFGAD